MRSRRSRYGNTVPIGAKSEEIVAIDQPESASLVPAECLSFGSEQDFHYWRMVLNTKSAQQYFV
jgi:hypothetical protein